MLKTRQIILRVDDLLNIFRAYMPEGDIPADAAPVKMMLNQSTREMGVMVESASFEDSHPLKVVFSHRKLYGGGNG